MAYEWFVRPDTKVIPIAHGATITVKKRLNMGQQREAFAKMAEQIDGKLRANPMKIGIAMVAAYLVDWSITDFDGKRVAIDTMSRDTLIDVLNDMDPAAFQIIHDAVDAHVVEVDAEREVEKNGQGDASKLSVISPSPVAATGDMSGSLN